MHTILLNKPGYFSFQYFARENTIMNRTKVINFILCNVDSSLVNDTHLGAYTPCKEPLEGGIRLKDAFQGCFLLSILLGFLQKSMGNHGP